ncbi:MAG TPA: STAS domain-containing protein [Casimicrobiaceae bacterium]|nr:STAS domain-containing protein [Casimicrobiaceae bacterium]
MVLFGKTPAKKPASAKPATGPKAAREPAQAGPRPVSARELAAAAAGRRAGRAGAFEPIGDTSLRGASIIDWSSAPAAIEVLQANPGLCDVLENAALLFASGQDAAARALLEQGVQADADARQSALAWLALFDLMQRAGDRDAFEQLAMHYVLQFESSAPSWEAAAPDKAGGAAHGGGYIAIAGALSAANPAPLEGLRRAVASSVPRARVDLAGLTDFDDAGARELAELLARARRQRMALAVQRPERLRTALDAAVARGREGGEGAWLLSLELLQWQHEQAQFDERALEFAVAFELSPPSWEPPAAEHGGPTEGRSTEGGSNAAAAASRTSEIADEPDVLDLVGVMAGATPPQLPEIEQFATLHDVVTVDMSRVERVDFVAAGAFLNVIARLESRHHALQIVGATPIVRALLLLIGASPRHFVRKVS